MSQRFSKRMLRSKEVRDIIAAIPEKWQHLLDRKEPVILWELETGATVLVVRQTPKWFRISLVSDGPTEISPFLPVLTELIKGEMVLPKVTVDMGAVPFVVRGADIMAPGIVAIEQGLMANMYAQVEDERNHKPLAVGLALRDGSSMMTDRKGKALKTIHYVGDAIWKLINTEASRLG